MNKTITTYELTQRLRAAVRPFEAGTAYGRGHVDRIPADGHGASRVVGCLAIRSGVHANADDVAHEMNAAHLAAARVWAAALTAQEVAQRVLLTVDADAVGVDVAAVLLCDAFGCSTIDDGADLLGRLFHGLRPDRRAETVDTVAAALAAAAALEAVAS